MRDRRGQKKKQNRHQYTHNRCKWLVMNVLHWMQRESKSINQRNDSQTTTCNAPTRMKTTTVTIANDPPSFFGRHVLQLSRSDLVPVGTKKKGWTCNSNPATGGKRAVRLMCGSSGLADCVQQAARCRQWCADQTHVRVPKTGTPRTVKWYTRQPGWHVSVTLAQVFSTSERANTQMNTNGRQQRATTPRYVATAAAMSTSHIAGKIVQIVVPVYQSVRSTSLAHGCSPHCFENADDAQWHYKSPGLLGDSGATIDAKSVQMASFEWLSTYMARSHAVSSVARAMV